MDLKVTFHDVEATDAIRAYVEKRAEKLPTFHDRILGCRVALEEPHRHKKHGRQYKISIECAIPGKTVAVTREPGHGEDKDLYAAIDDAFDKAVRALRHEKERADPAQGGQTIRGS